MREYSATVGDSDGNIIAAIITTQMPRNHPSVPRLVHGPPSMPCIRSTVHHQPTAARAKSSATRASRARAAANAGAGPARPAGRSWAAITCSGGPGEACLRKPCLALVLDAERIDPGALRLRHREIRPDRVEHSVEPDRPAILGPKRNDVLDLEIDRVADADAVTQSIVLHIDPRALDPEHLPHEWSKPGHRAAELPGENLDELVCLLVGRLLVDEHAEPPVSLRHDFRRVGDRGHLEPGHVGSLDFALSDVENEHDTTEVVRRAVVERQVARAHQLAGTRLYVVPSQAP